MWVGYRRGGGGEKVVKGAEILESFEQDYGLWDFQFSFCSGRAWPGVLGLFRLAVVITMHFRALGLENDWLHA